MSDEKELKVYLSKDERPIVTSYWPPLFIAVVPALLAAVASYWAASLAYEGDLRAIEGEKNRALLEIAQAREDTRLAALRDEFSSEEFRAQGDHIKWIAITESIAKALEFEAIVRNGATILALEELWGIRDEWNEPIEASLTHVQRVLLVDSTFTEKNVDGSLNKRNSKIYCTESIGTGRTNADDIVDLIKHLPVRIAARKLEPTLGADELTSEEELQANEIFELVRSGRPDLIVVHEEAFAEFGTSNQQQTLLDELLRSALFANQTSSVIVYSRGGVALELMTKLRNEHGFQRPIIGIEMGLSEDVGDDCIEAGSHNGVLIETAIRRALGHGTLYSRDWGPRP